MSRSSLEVNAAAETNRKKKKSNYYISNLNWPSSAILHKSNTLIEMFLSQMRRRGKKNGGTCTVCTGKPSSFHNREKSQLWVLIKDLMKSQSSKDTIQRQEAGGIYLKLTEWKVL